MRHATLAIILAATLYGAAFAADRPYGADGLPYLAQRAALVIRAADPKPIDGDPRVALYRVGASEVLKGEAPREPFAVVIILESGERPDPTSIDGSILFLAGPMNDRQRAPWNLKVDGPLYRVVSGRYGIVSLRDDNRRVIGAARLAAIKEYVGADKKVDWAARHWIDQDQFVQRSALLELSAQPPDNAQALDLLSDCLRRGEVTPSNKQVAISALEVSNSDKALAPLRDLSRDTNAPKSLRTSAVQALAAVPGGRQELRRIGQEADPDVSRLAREVYERTAKVDGEPAPRATPDEVKARLQSKDPNEVSRGLKDAKTLTFDEELGGWLKAVATQGSGRPLAKKEAVGVLSSFNKRGAADVLAAIAKDDKQPKDVRRAAILGIRRMESGVGTSVLASLSSDVKDEELKKFAAGLNEGR